MQPLTAGLIVSNRDLLSEVQASLAELPVRVVVELTEAGDWGPLAEKLDRLRPDVMLLEFAQFSANLENIVRAIRHTAGGPAVIVINAGTNPEIILRAMRAGAAEYLYPPFGPGLKQALERISGDRAAPDRPRGKTFAFFSAKGGCGATTIACHVALELQRQTRREILLADLDLDAGMVGFFMKSRSSYSVLDAVSSLHRLDLSYWKALVSNGIPGLEVIKAPPAISPRKPDDQQRLRFVLNFVRSHYDWVVADFGRTLSPPMVDALEEVDEAFMVTTLDLPALHQAKQIATRLRESGCGERLRLLLNRVPRRTDITIDEVRQLLDLEVTGVLPDGSAELYESYADGKLLPPNTNLARHIATLTSKIAGVPLQAPAKRKFSLLG